MAAAWRRTAPGLAGAADAAAVVGDDEAEVHAQPAVSGPSVGPHVGARLHDRELDLEAETASQRQAEDPAGGRPGTQHKPVLSYSLSLRGISPAASTSSGRPDRKWPVFFLNHKKKQKPVAVCEQLTR